MAQFSPQSLWWRFWRSQRRTKLSSQAGFTLAELLVTVFISSGIIAGLMYLVTELTSTNQREAARNETQRDMQNALDYISADLREAVYVYTGECLQGVGGSEDNNYCPGILTNLPTALNNATSTPILAFWKNELLPAEVRRRCAAGSVPVDSSGNRANCSTGHAYNLVVYSLNTANPSDTWKGRARITRYELSPFNSSANPVSGYVPPATDSGGVPLFRIWPLDKDKLPRVPAPPRPSDTSAVLVDFVDLALDGNTEFAETANPCPSADYKVTPSTAAVRSFYACVLEPPGQTNIGRESVDILVHLRGNAYGKPGILNENSFLTGLETRVYSQSAVGKGPGSPGQ